MLPAILLLAAIIGPVVYEQDDNGDIALQEFTYVLSADCNAATINVTVKDENLTLVEDAKTFLKYVDVTEPVIGQGKTGRDGFFIYELPGNVSLMRGLFVLLIEKDGYRNKEVHFDLSPCYPKPAPPKKPPANNSSATNQSNTSNQPRPVSNNTTRINNTVNVTEPNGNDLPFSMPCPAALVLPLLMFYKPLKR